MLGVSKIMSGVSAIVYFSNDIFRDAGEGRYAGYLTLGIGIS